MKSTKAVIAIRLPAETKARIEKEADALNISFNATVNLLICKGLKSITTSHSPF